MKSVLAPVCILLLIILGTSSCEEQQVQTKFFSPEKLQDLSIDSLVDFWENDSIVRISDFITANFYIDSARLGAIEYSSARFSRIAVCVFMSGDDAFRAMEDRRNSVAGVIRYGNTDEIPGVWWYGESYTYALFVNSWNTIIEFEYNSTLKEESKSKAFSAAHELIKRIDKLSITQVKTEIRKF
jgi:hypothetical protein